MSYLGGKVALIAGGAGAVGEGVTRQLLEAGFYVLVPSRSAERLERLRQRLEGSPMDRLDTIEDHIGTPEGAERIREHLLVNFGAPDLVVASLGGWWQGPGLVEVDLATWHQVLTDNLTSHLVVARQFLPLMTERPESLYVMLNGNASERPVPYAGLISIAAAAQLMLKDVLVAEQRVRSPRIHTLSIDTPVISRDRPEGPADWLRADDVGQAVVTLYTALEGELAPGATIHLASRADAIPFGVHVTDA